MQAKDIVRAVERSAVGHSVTAEVKAVVGVDVTAVAASANSQEGAGKRAVGKSTVLPIKIENPLAKQC